MIVLAARHYSHGEQIGIEHKNYVAQPSTQTKTSSGWPNDQV